MHTHRRCKQLEVYRTYSWGCQASQLPTINTFWYLQLNAVSIKLHKKRNIRFVNFSPDSSFQTLIKYLINN